MQINFFATKSNITKTIVLAEITVYLSHAIVTDA